MSRVGYKPIALPSGVEVVIEGSKVTVKGPKGELCRSFSEDIGISLQDGVLSISRPSDSRVHRALHGFTRSVLANMVEGVSQGFRKDLELHGVGYRVQKSGDSLMIQVGYTQPIEIKPPPGITLASDAPNQASVLGIDKELVGEIAAQIRGVRSPDPYLGKGIRYAGERIRRKAGKAGKLGRRK
ncbi:MAG TPA: 50S ribosomal protein L6 [Dehalococcoidia bacterium]|nr:50S ribosomal protein L6 [Dehalococcoidia bacterium]